MKVHDGAGEGEGEGEDMEGSRVEHVDSYTRYQTRSDSVRMSNMGRTKLVDDLQYEENQDLMEDQAQAEFRECHNEHYSIRLEKALSWT